MKKILIGMLVCFGILTNGDCMQQRTRGEVGGMDSDFFQRQWELQQSPVMHFTESELQSIYSTTTKEKSATSIPEDQESLLPHVLSGNPIALFEFAQRDGGKARLTYNGEKQKLLLERGVLLLIAAVQGGHHESQESLNFAADTPINYESLTSLESIITKAKELTPKL